MPVSDYASSLRRGKANNICNKVQYRSIRSYLGARKFTAVADYMCEPDIPRQYDMK